MAINSDSIQIRDAADQSRAGGDEHKVQPGYKDTEVGVIPQDWDVLPLSTLCRQIVDGTHFTPRYVADGVPFYSVENVTADDFDNVKYISRSEHERLAQRCKPQRGDILLTRIGSLGDTKLIDWDVDASIYVSLALLKVGDAVDASYVYGYTQGNRFVRDIENRSLLNAAPKKINMGDIGAVPIAVPPRREEQRAIAEALSDVHGLLGALDTLIAKKRAIKQAVMQQLLTGKTRLPGFSGEWATKRLGDTADIWSGATPSTQVAAYWNGGIQWCTPTDITGTLGKYLLATERRITAEGLASCAAKLLPAGALLLCSRATIGEIKIAASPVCTNQGFKSLICRSGVSNEFLYYLLLTLKPQMIERAIGSTFLEIGKRDVASIQVRMPSYGEQQAIATALSDIDAEIAALEGRREKTSAVKQGMMQQLLTGRVRLVKPASEESSA
jgi:type I restriction enzyme, S subunit